MHITVFEYGYIACDKQAEGEMGASCISSDAFHYLREVCLGAAESDLSRCLSLTKRHGVELLQVKNYVGVIFTPGGECIEVLPKVGRHFNNTDNAPDYARQVLLMMLSHLGSFRHIASHPASVASQKMPLLEVFISQFLHSVNVLIKRGLKSDYVAQQDNLAFQKGKLLVAQQLRHNQVNKHKFYVEYDEFLINRPANRLIKSALVAIASQTRMAANQKLLRELLFAFADVPVSPAIKQDVQSLKLDRSMTDYVSPLAWVKMILDGISPLAMKGQAEALSLLFPMEAVFESYVASVLSTQLPEGSLLTTQAQTEYLVTHKKRRQFQLKPDLVLTMREGSQTVMDTKWKLLDVDAYHYGLSQSDLYQMFAYGHKYLHGSGSLFLIYPAHSRFNQPIECSFDFSETLRLWVVPFVIDLDGKSRVIWPSHNRLQVS
ncbi:hypothetical protein JCM19237_2144 [Photobacterium aphoticum]|uniref:Restriction endonuclease n=1 Tax=Photobacterium aphoticum TaxID=754436 RepID=A0A090QP53_9GAMM|nr:hypothetical protein JCM19237_2144 [Photobacterium aphoticum]